MDTGQLLKVLDDIKQDEENFAFQSSFQNILTYYNQNNPSSLNEEKEALEADIDISIVGNYVITDYKILESLNINKFFGIISKIELNNILSSQAHEVKIKIESFVQKRQEILNKINTLKNSLEVFDIEARTLEDNQYEIGFVFPEDYANLPSLKKALSDVENFLSALADTSGDDKKFHINSVSNGSIEIFISASAALAEHFGTALRYVLDIYSGIKAFNEIKEKYRNYSEKNKKIIDDTHKEELEETTKKLTDQFIDSLKIQSHEDQNRVRNLFKKIVGHFESGVNAEVRIPPIEEPDELSKDADAEEKKKNKELKRLYEIKKSIEDRNKEIFKLQQNNFYGSSVKFLNSMKVDENKDS